MFNPFSISQTFMQSKYPYFSQFCPNFVRGHSLKMTPFDSFTKVPLQDLSGVQIWWQFQVDPLNLQ